MRVAAVQSTATSVPEDNLGAAGRLVDAAAGEGAELVVLPEYFSVAGNRRHMRAHAETLDGPTVAWAAETARRHRIWLLAGSFPESPTAPPGRTAPLGRTAPPGRTAPADERLHNTSCLIAPDGSLAAVYRKVHLFDVTVPGAEYRESTTVAPGDTVVTAPVGRPVLGLSICYDLRFPEVYRILTLQGATMVAVPAAFTAATGPPHWEILLRARAIENQLFVIAAGQVGDLPPGMPACHGHSMIIDPWGTVLAERVDPTPGMIVADLDEEAQRRMRTELPVLANRRPDAYRWPDDSSASGAGHH